MTDPFEEYYNEAQAHPKKVAKVAKPAEEVMSDTKLLKPALTSYIKKLNRLIGDVLEKERERKTKADLVVTLIVGGLAFTLANVLVLLNKQDDISISDEEFESSLTKMFRSALADIRSKESGA